MSEKEGKIEECDNLNDIFYEPRTWFNEGQIIYKLGYEKNDSNLIKRGIEKLNQIPAWMKKQFNHLFNGSEGQYLKNHPHRNTIQSMAIGDVVELTEDINEVIELMDKLNSPDEIEDFINTERGMGRLRLFDPHYKTFAECVCSWEEKEEE